MEAHDYVPDCECRECLRVTLRDTVAAAERLAIERAEFRIEADRLREELAALLAQEPVAWMTRTDTERVFWMNSPKSIFHDATPLYASPAPAAVPDGVREVRYLTDERDLDPEDQHELIIALGGNGDWYVSVLPKGHRFGPTVRLCTSGGASSAVPGLCTAIAGAFRTLAAATQEGK